MEKLKKILLPIDIILGVVVLLLVVLLVVVKVGDIRANRAGSSRVKSDRSNVQAETETGETELNTEYEGFTVDSGYKPEERSMENALDNPQAFLFPTSADALLTEADLQGKSAMELTYGRNEIYARHGYVFVSSELNSYFATKSWYTENPDFTAEQLNATEIANGEFINQYQEANNLQYTPQ